jgi:uncharacterized protein YcfJ
LRTQTLQTANSTGSTIVGAVAGGLRGNMIGGGSGRTIATVVGAVGGGCPRTGSSCCAESHRGLALLR